MNQVFGILATALLIQFVTPLAAFAQSPRIPDVNLTPQETWQQVIAEVDSYLPAGTYPGRLSTGVPCEIEVNYKTTEIGRALRITILFPSGAEGKKEDLIFSLQPTERSVLALFDEIPNLTTIHVVKEFLIGPSNSEISSYLLYLRTDQEDRLSEVTIYNERKANVGTSILSCQLDQPLIHSNSSLQLFPKRLVQHPVNF